LIQNLSPNKITRIIPSAHGALELPSNTIRDKEIQIGDHLDVKPDEHFHANLDRLKKILHWPINVFMASLWGLFVASSFLSWQQNGKILSLGLLIVNTLLLFLFLTRRESTDISRRVRDWLIPILTVVLSMALRPHPVINSTYSGVSVTLQCIGIIAITISLLSLGRSFGVIPANRGIKDVGFYKIVRHPLYASEMLFYFGFLIGNMSLYNLPIVILILWGQIYRSVSEEQLLSKENSYRDYMDTVKYRMIPGIF
jgi:protein-S-isoprenylcysteine O-methyltransferase Ste14